MAKINYRKFVQPVKRSNGAFKSDSIESELENKVRGFLGFAGVQVDRALGDMNTTLKEYNDTYTSSILGILDSYRIARKRIDGQIIAPYINDPDVTNSKTWQWIREVDAYLIDLIKKCEEMVKAAQDAQNALNLVTYKIEQLSRYHENLT